MDSIDILIIGGGPAGISTALHLVSADPRLAPRILVLEKDQYPRDKLCGGGLVGDAEILLENLGVDLNEVPSVKAKSIQINFRGKGPAFTNRKGHALRLIRRDEFDAWLAAKAKARGVEIREGVRVREVSPGDKGVTVQTDQGDFHAQVVVGADGSNGITRRCVFPTNPGSRARVLEVITPDSDPSTSPHADTSAYFDFLPVPQGIAGYVWDFPTQVNGLPMRCWGIYDANLFPRKNRPPLKEILYTEMQSHGHDPSTLDLQGHPILWFSPDNHLSTWRILLVGDAVGTDSLFGEGISFALGYGKIAAGSIIDAFNRDDFSFKPYKRHVLRSSLGRALISRWLIANFIYSFHWTWFQYLLWRILKPITLLVAWLFLLNWGKRL